MTTPLGTSSLTKGGILRGAPQGGFMYMGSLEHGRIIAAFQRHVPDVYVRDYRGGGGFITICRNYRTIKWADQMATSKVEKMIPAITLCNLPRGNVTAMSRFVGLKLDRPGWRQEFRRAARYLSYAQKRAITRDFRVGEVFYGVR